MKTEIKYGAIDIAKLLFAFGVVGLHTGLFLEKRWGFYLHDIIFRLGVPFFFLSSGYFLGRKTTIENKAQFLKKYIYKLIPLYLLWNAFYVPYGLIHYQCYSHYALLDGIWRTLIGKSATVMWFVGCLIWCVVILLHIKNEKKLPLITGIFAGLYVIGLFFNTYNWLFTGSDIDFLRQWLTNTFQSNSNFLFCGFYFVGCGYTMAKYPEPTWLRLQRDRILVLICCGFFLLCETILVKGNLATTVNHEYYLAHLLLIPVLFLFLRDLKLPSINTAAMRTLSSDVYYVHFLSIYAISLFSKNYPWSIFQTSLGSYCVILGLTLVICVVYIKIKHGINAVKYGTKVR